MKVIALTGLVAIEKIELAHDLADHFTATGQRVTVFDNVARLPMTAGDMPAPVNRVDGDILPQLPDLVGDSDADTVIIALSEQTHPHDLFVALDNLYLSHDDIEVRTIALVDTRTCDCFPTVREALETYADVTVNLPFGVTEVINHLDI